MSNAGSLSPRGEAERSGAGGWGGASLALPACRRYPGHPRRDILAIGYGYADETRMRTLSSSLTWFYKFALPSLWIGMVAIQTPRMFLAASSAQGGDPGGASWLFLALTVVGILALYLFCMRLKRVRLGPGVLLISNYWSEVEVPLSNVKRATGSRLMNPEFIWLRFRQPTEFGAVIIFMAPWRVFVGLSAHPLVEELQVLIVAASEDGAALPDAFGG